MFIIRMSFHANSSEPEGKRRKLLTEFNPNPSCSEVTVLQTQYFPDTFLLFFFFTEPSVWVWIWGHVCLVPVCVHGDYGLQHHMSHYCTFWWVACCSYISHTEIRFKLLHCGVFLQVSSTWCWSTWSTNTTCTLPICQLALNATSIWEPLIKLWPHPSSVWYGFTSSLCSE